MKFLIIPGFAKSGTTFLYEQLAASGAPINLPKRKEVDYFRSADSLEGYLDQFDTQDPDKVFLDASPLYALPGTDVAARIKKTLKGHDVKIVFCLRDPMARAYSHYMHDISTHFFLYAHGPYSFYSPAVLKKYFHPLSPAVRDFATIFGKANVSGFGFKSSGPQLRGDVLKFLSLPKTWHLDFNVNPAPGGSIPRLYFDTDRYLTIRSGKELYALPPHTFLLSNIRYQQYRPDFPAHIAKLLLKNSASWDRQFNPEFLGPAVKPIRDDYLKCFDALGMDREDLKPPKVINANDPPALTPDIRNNMEKLGTVSATLVDNFRPAAKTKGLLGQSKAAVSPNPVAQDKHETLPNIIKSVNDMQGKSNGKRAQAYQYALAELGPVPDYVRGYLRHLIQLGDADNALKYLKTNPNLNRYISFKVMLEDLDKFSHKFTQQDLKDLRKFMGS